MEENVRPEFNVRPGIKCAVLSAVILGIGVILGLVSHYGNSELFTMIYRVALLPILAVICIVSLLFFLLRKISVYETGISIYFVKGWKQSFMYDDISKIELVFGRVGYSVPIRIYADGKKCITIVPSYKGYDLLLHKLEKTCKEKIQKI